VFRAGRADGAGVAYAGTARVDGAGVAYAGTAPNHSAVITSSASRSAAIRSSP
jgi:hypothetical protein